jgi:histidinol-phosphate/aromatic aminotransferase/cobyric acid decarboxylase-like protein
MKLEIEITEEEIKRAIELRVRAAVADQNNAWSAENHIKDRVKHHWNTAVEAMVAQAIGDSAKLKEMVDRAVEARARVQAALKSI